MNAVEINNLTKYYGKSRGIIDVSFNVEEGEIFGFIGPNGAGKSTTIRLLLALIYPTSGSAKIFGKDCIKERHEIAKHIGYLPSEVFYYDNMKVMDLLRYSAGFYKKDCTRRIKELAGILDLDLSRKIGSSRWHRWQWSLCRYSPHILPIPKASEICSWDFLPKF
ncbi:MAG TPA: ATP-binding cassette domain-containing protein [Clostridiaceae bacterium]|nr:ATP-binding cassette domain-containing protein [Clostridiaceae bacterium]